MVDYSKINYQIEKFELWSRPWTFQASVDEQLINFPAERALFSAVWTNATKHEIWTTVTTEKINECVGNWLELQYPWLTKKSVQKIIKGAAYQWK